MNCDGQLKAEITQMAAYYEHRLQLGTKAIFHLEAFVAKFMAIYKRFLEEGIADMLWSQPSALDVLPTAIVYLHEDYFNKL